VALGVTLAVDAAATAVVGAVVVGAAAVAEATLVEAGALHPANPAAVSVEAAPETKTGHPTFSAFYVKVTLYT